MTATLDECSTAAPVLPTSNESDISTRLKCISSTIPYDIFLIVAFLCWKGEAGENDANFPATVSQVCRTWRRYALDTAALWSNLSFQHPNVERTVAKYRIWLERTSDGSPLDISIGSQPLRVSSVKRAKAIFQLILPHVGRWRTLHVDAVPAKILRHLFERLRDAPAPMLETLRLTRDTACGYPRPSWPAKWKLIPFTGGKAPVLRELELEELPYEHFLKTFTSLERLKISSSEFPFARPDKNVASIRHILHSLPSLRSLHLDYNVSYAPFYSFPSHMPTTTSRQAHPSLTRLILSLPNNTVPMALSSLDLPQVRYFLAADEVEATSALGLLPIMARNHPFPNLVSLRRGPKGIMTPTERITKATMDMPGREYLRHLQDALSGLSELRFLTFDLVYFAANDLLCLGAACPRLQSLTLVQCAGCTLESLRCVVEDRGRRSDLHPLTQLSIVQWGDESSIIIDKDADAWFKSSSLVYKVFPPLMIGDFYRNEYL
ncbi:hypothetical protein FRB90_002016 [Tulasnella sp. 427]|nr:hypothetical protein FRB90_002016 [Tulasnella sp. 427]